MAFFKNNWKKIVTSVTGVSLLGVVGVVATTPNEQVVSQEEVTENNKENPPLVIPRLTYGDRSSGFYLARFELSSSQRLAKTIFGSPGAGVNPRSRAAGGGPTPLDFNNLRTSPTSTYSEIRNNINMLDKGADFSQPMNKIFFNNLINDGKVNMSLFSFIENAIIRFRFRIPNVFSQKQKKNLRDTFFNDFHTALGLQKAKDGINWLEISNEGRAKGIDKRPMSLQDFQNAWNKAVNLFVSKNKLPY